MKKYILITGGSQGIGLSLLKALDLPNLVIHNISRTSANFIPKKCQFTQSSYDLSNPVESELNSILESFFKNTSSESPVFLVNNAAMIGQIKPLKELTKENLETTFSLNFISPFLLSKVFINQRNSFKRIINISTGAAENAYASWIPYCTSKTSLKMLGACIQLEYPSLSVINFKPGVIETNMQKTLRATDPKDFPMHSKFQNLFETNQLVNPDELAVKMKILFDESRDFPLELKASDLL